MIDRNDIDALLIGALYGELTPADEARLSAHLESHPTDRSALDGLRSTREAVRESRFLAFQVDPPQAISALLLQEAARRAPKMVPVRSEKESEGGWFARFVRSFAAHPAMAAAAMLVMVVGVGGLLYMKNGANTYSDATVDERGAEAIVASQSPTTAPGAAAMDHIAQRGENDKNKAGDDAESFRVDLADGFGKTTGAAAGSGSSAAYAYREKTDREKTETKGVVVNTPDPTVKDFPDKQQQDQKVAATSPKKGLASKTKTDPRSANDVDGLAKVEGAKENQFAAAPTQTGTGTSVTTGNTNAVSGAGVASGVANNAPPPRGEDATKKPQESPKQDPSLLAWAKDQHTAATKAVKAKNCAEAARLASMIGTRAPEYYNANIVNDRDLKACQQYIATEREKDAEQSNKARAQKRLDANEVSPSPSNK